MGFAARLWVEEATQYIDRTRMALIAGRKLVMGLDCFHLAGVEQPATFEDTH